MKEYNAAFFGLYENAFIVLKEGFGEEKAWDIFRQIMEKGLKKAYDAAEFQKGSTRDFVRVVGERDAGVGLRVKFPDVDQDKIVYQFYADPFPNLKGHVDHEKLDDTYMAFKVRYLLGDDWKYKNTKHFWDGDDFTEFVIARNSP